jgi:Spy/CpxP family protein refolding chaperone
MKTKLILLAGALALSGLLAGPAGAQWSGHDEKADKGGMMGGSGTMAAAGGMGGGMADMMQTLGLDDEQWKKFSDLRRKYRLDTIPMQAKIDIAEVELEALTDTDKLDLKKIEAKIREIAGLEADLRTYRYKSLAEMRSFISADQFQKFRWLGMKMGFSGGEDHGGGHGGHGH